MTTAAFYSRLLPWASGALLAVVINAILTIALLISITDTLPAVIMAVAVALLLELGKWCALVDRSRIARCLAPLLVMLSVAANLGALQSGLDQSRSEASAAALSRAQLSAQLAQLDAQLAQNNRAIDRYIALDRIRTGAAPLQAVNREIAAERAALVARLDAVAVVRPGELAALLDNLAGATGFPADRLEAVALLTGAVLFDLIGAFFLLRLSARLGALPKRRKSVDKTSAIVDTPVPERSGPADNVVRLPEADRVYRKLTEAIKAGDLPPSQRAVLADPGFPIGSTRVRKLFRRLERDGVIVKHKSNAYRLAG